MGGKCEVGPSYRQCFILKDLYVSMCWIGLKLGDFGEGIFWELSSFLYESFSFLYSNLSVFMYSVYVTSVVYFSFL